MGKNIVDIIIENGMTINSVRHSNSANIRKSVADDVFFHLRAVVYGEVSNNASLARIKFVLMHRNTFQ